MSYVEWARAIDVAPAGDARFDVMVAYRTLAGAAGLDVVRQPVRAVVVRVAVGEGGATVVVELPTPVSLPERYRVAPAAETLAGEAPAEVIDRSLLVVQRAGFDPVLIGSARGVGGWWVTVAGTDQSNLRFPFRVWTPGE